MVCLLTPHEPASRDRSKRFAFPKTYAKIPLAPSGKSPLRTCVILSQQEGRLAIATNAGQGAVDAAPDRKACEGMADGEAVWS